MRARLPVFVATTLLCGGWLGCDTGAVRDAVEGDDHSIRVHNAAEDRRGTDINNHLRPDSWRLDIMDYGSQPLMTSGDLFVTTARAGDLVCAKQQIGWWSALKVADLRSGQWQSVDQLVTENVSGGIGMAAAKIAAALKAAGKEQTSCPPDPQLCAEIELLQEKISKLAMALIGRASDAQTAASGMGEILTALKVVANALATVHESAGCGHAA